MTIDDVVLGQNAFADSRPIRRNLSGANTLNAANQLVIPPPNFSPNRRKPPFSPTFWDISSDLKSHANKPLRTAPTLRNRGFSSILDIATFRPVFS